MVDTAVSDASEYLKTALDDLWSQYFSLLDQYLNIRQSLATDLANVYHRS